MKRYRYKAKNSKAEWVTGEIEAAHQDDAVTRLSASGIMPVEVEELMSVASAPDIKKSQGRVRSIKKSEISFFYKQLGRMMKSGLSLLNAMALLRQEAVSRGFRMMMAEIEEKIRQGESLSSSLGAYPQYYSLFDVSMIQAGESVGDLGESLKRIADYRDQEERVRKKLAGALIYPSFVVSVGLISVFFIVAYVIPKFSKFFEGLGQELPWLTRALMHFSGFVSTYWIAIFVVLLGIIAFLKTAARSLRWKSYQSSVLLKLPVLGRLARMIQIARFSRTLALLVSCGIPMLRAMRISVPSLTNEILKSEMEQAARKLEKGESLSQTFKAAGCFPPLVAQLVKVGEETGRIDTVLNELGDWYESESVDEISMLMQIIEPLMILVVALMVGVVVVAILLPVFSLNALVV